MDRIAVVRWLEVLDVEFPVCAKLKWKNCYSVTINLVL